MSMLSLDILITTTAELTKIHVFEHVNAIDSD